MSSSSLPHKLLVVRLESIELVGNGDFHVEEAAAAAVAEPASAQGGEESETLPPSPLHAPHFHSFLSSGKLKLCINSLHMSLATAPPLPQHHHPHSLRPTAGLHAHPSGAPTCLPAPSLTTVILQPLSITTSATSQRRASATAFHPFFQASIAGDSHLTLDFSRVYASLHAQTHLPTLLMTLLNYSNAWGNGEAVSVSNQRLLEEEEALMEEHLSAMLVREGGAGGSAGASPTSPSRHGARLQGGEGHHRRAKQRKSPLASQRALDHRREQVATRP
jgi:hypothetical protein